VFGLFEQKLPVTDEQKVWNDGSLIRLASLLNGTAPLRDPIVLPTPEHFPDPYDNSEAALHRIFRRVAARMKVDPDQIEVVLFNSADRMTSGLVPFYSGSHSAAAGLYHHNSRWKTQISIEGQLLKDPMALVGVVAHELGHALLLRPGLVDQKDKDMEPLTPLDQASLHQRCGLHEPFAAVAFRKWPSVPFSGAVANYLEKVPRLPLPLARRGVAGVLDSNGHVG
jgi:hypothetical protein